MQLASPGGAGERSARGRPLAAIAGRRWRARGRGSFHGLSGFCQSPVASLCRAPSAFDRARSSPQRVLHVIAALGCAISIYMLHGLIENPPPVAICGRSIDYGGNENALSWRSLLYLVCTCAPLLLSSSGTIRRFGALVAGGFVVSATVYFTTYISVWCFFAAAGSGLLYFYFRRAAPNPGP
jgi:hypothetical protein